MKPLFSVRQSRELDNFAVLKLNYPSILLMENGSLTLLSLILHYNKDFTPGDKIGIVCGKGNNGGDGFALARQLVAREFNVFVLHLFDEKEFTHDSAVNFTILKSLNSKLLTLKKFTSIKDLAILRDSRIIVDAILGTGTVGPLAEPLKSIVEKLNTFPAFKVAADVPTGLNADTGHGETIFEADLTVSLGSLKRGLFIGKGYEYCGTVEYASIGVNPDWLEAETDDFIIEQDDFIYSMPVKKKTANKYTAGKVLTIGGSGKYFGAGEMTAFSALRVGAGASVLAIPESIRNNFLRYPELVIEPYPDNDFPYLSADAVVALRKRIQWADIIAVGPGLGREEETIEAVIYLINQHPGKSFVIDADALFAISKVGYNKVNLRNSVLTPHLGEFELLSGIPLSELQKDLLKAGRDFAMKTKSTLILKNAKTIHFSPDGEGFINLAGNPGLAKFGSGDVLTGVIAGLGAQTRNPVIDNRDLFLSILSAVYLHSFAADCLMKKYTEFGYTATDLMNYLPKAIKKLMANK
ncbi:MAG: NAD(P)H-hydrate dehydratase [Ignavibacteriaceae bacterium]